MIHLIVQRVTHTLRRIHSDITKRFVHIDLYIWFIISLFFTVIGVTGIKIDDADRTTELYFAVIIGGMALLLFNRTIPANDNLNYDLILKNRYHFESKLDERIKTVSPKSLWIYGATADNVLNTDTQTAIRDHILKQGGEVRLLIQNPNIDASMEKLRQQIDDPKDYPPNNMDDAMESISNKIKSMSQWNSKLEGTFTTRYLEYSPGFSMIIFNGNTSNGIVIVEFYGFHTQDDEDRMHIEITSRNSPDWYEYWRSQFCQMWKSKYTVDVDFKPIS